MKLYNVVESWPLALAVSNEFHESMQTGHGVENWQGLLLGLLINAEEIIDHGLIIHNYIRP